MPSKRRSRCDTWSRTIRKPARSKRRPISKEVRERHSICEWESSIGKETEQGLKHFILIEGSSSPRPSPPSAMAGREWCWELLSGRMWKYVENFHLRSRGKFHWSEPSADPEVSPAGQEILSCQAGRRVGPRIALKASGDPGTSPRRPADLSRYTATFPLKEFRL